MHRQHSSFQDPIDEEQYAAFQEIKASIGNNKSYPICVVQVQSGFVKTHLLNNIQHYRAEGVLCVAPTIFAALFLPDGQSTHDLFEILENIKPSRPANVRHFM